MVITRRAPTRTAQPARQTGGYRGAEGRKMMELEEERAKARKEAAALNSHMPFRFFCPEGGEPRQFVIIDEEPDFFRHEHCLKDKRSGKWNIFCECLGENANCPVCKVAERPSYFGMFLTIIDLESYINKDNVEVPWSKKLLMVKTQQQKKFTRLHSQHGSLRGMIIEVTRDSQKDSSIGNDIQFIDFMDEDELLTYETVYIDSNKKSHDIIGHEVFDYDELFPRPTEQQLRALVGGKAEPGSREDDDAALGRRSPRRGSGDDWEDKEPAPTRRISTRTASARADRIPPEDNPEEGGEDAGEEAPAPRRAPRSSAPATRQAPATRARRAAPVEDADADVEGDAEPEQEEAQPRRPARNTTRAARPDPEEEAPQRQSAASLADKRRALRR